MKIFGYVCGAVVVCVLGLLVYSIAITPQVEYFTPTRIYYVR